MGTRQYSRWGILVSAATLALGTAAHAAFIVPRNGVTWAATFEGDVPALTGSTPAWATWDVADSNGATSDGNIRTYITGNEAGANSYEFNGTSWTGGGTARTVELRLRVPADGQYEAADGQGSLLIGMGDGVNPEEAMDFRFFNGQLKYNFSSGLASILSIDTSVYHIYRVTINELGSPQASLYIDNNPTPAFTTNDQWFTSAGFDKIIYGDVSQGGEAGKMDVDYISWTSGAGAPPVPEPSCLALLAVGIALLGKRRRM